MILLAAFAVAAVISPAPTFRVTVSATETATSKCDPRLPAPEQVLTLHASLRSTAPVTATLRGGGIHLGEIPLQATVSVDKPGCGYTAPSTCGPKTVGIVPGGFLTVAAGRMRFSYDSNGNVFPEDPSSCSSGLMEVDATTAFDPKALLLHRTSTVSGTTARDVGDVHIELAYTVTFTRVR